MYNGTGFKPTSGDTARGWLTAVDADGGAVRWRFRAPAPLVAGVTHTAGGLVLTGDLAGNLYAFDNATGKVAFQTNLGGAIAGGVMTYETRGRQYVAATAGNIGRTTFGVLGSPTLVVLGLGRPAQAGAGASPAGAELALPEIATGNAQNLSVRTGALGDVASEGAAGERVYQVCAGATAPAGRGYRSEPADLEARPGGHHGVHQGADRQHAQALSECVERRGRGGGRGLRHDAAEEVAGGRSHDRSSSREISRRAHVGRRRPRGDSPP